MCIAMSWVIIANTYANIISPDIAKLEHGQGLVVDLTGETAVEYHQGDFFNDKDDFSMAATNFNENEASFTLNKIEAMTDDLNRTLYVMNLFDDMKHRKALMRNTNNLFYFKQVHSSMYYDEKEKAWYEYRIKQDEKPKLETYPFLIPSSPCINGEDSSGGSISSTYQVQVSLSDAISGELSFAVSPLTLTANLGFTVGTSFQFSGGYTCLVKKGEYAQLFIEPFTVEVPESKRRRVAYKRLKGVVATQGEFEEFEKFRLIAKHKPNHYCLVTKDPSELKCAHKIGG